MIIFIKQILKFLFGKSTYDCINCIYCTSTGHGGPCNYCDGNYYEDKNIK